MTRRRQRLGNPEGVPRRELLGVAGPAATTTFNASTRAALAGKRREASTRGSAPRRARAVRPPARRVGARARAQEGVARAPGPPLPAPGGPPGDPAAGVPGPFGEAGPSIGSAAHKGEELDGRDRRLARRARPPGEGSLPDPDHPPAFASTTTEFEETFNASADALDGAPVTSLADGTSPPWELQQSWALTG